MWSLTNNTPFAAERCWVRDEHGAEIWIVAVKGTFLINCDEGACLAEQQEDVFMAPKFRGDPDRTSLLYEADLVHSKSSTDVIMHGHAYAPHGEPTTEVDVSLKLGSIDKTLRVFGNRVWEGGVFGVKLSKPEPFIKMPLTYERAFGGSDQTVREPKQPSWEPRNPVGTGFAIQSEHLVGKPAANVEDPKSLIKEWNSRPQPVGFGPIARHWTPRARFAGTYDEAWEAERRPLLPEDFDRRFYQFAPQDQQVNGFLKGGETVELHNFTPDGFCRSRLPWVKFGFTTRFIDNEVCEHSSVLHAVILEPDINKLIMVWHTHLPCHDKVQMLRETTMYQKKRLRRVGSDPLTGEWNDIDE